MFAKISALFSILKNLDKIKEVAQSTYLGVSKTLEVLLFIQSEINGTKLGVLLQNNLPRVIDVLTKVKLAFEQYGKFFGIEANTVSIQSATSESSRLAELSLISSKIDEFLK